MNAYWFDRSTEYDEMLRKGIRLSGEDKLYFVRGRIRDLKRQLPKVFYPRRILDFGCGIGDSSRFLAACFEESEVVGVDNAVEALKYAESACRNARISFRHLQYLEDGEQFDLCYTNGVFHHIEPAERLDVLQGIKRSLTEDGFFAFFENNPWNPGTRMVMRRIPFDRDAKALSPLDAVRLIRSAGFEPRGPARFLFYFPHALRLFRFSEPWLARIPFGAQYHILAKARA